MSPFAPRRRPRRIDRLSHAHAVRIARLIEYIDREANAILETIDPERLQHSGLLDDQTCVLGKLGALSRIAHDISFLPAISPEVHR